MKAEEPEAVKGTEESEKEEENKVQKKKIGFREKRVRIFLLSNYFVNVLYSYTLTMRIRL